MIYEMVVIDSLDSKAVGKKMPKLVPYFISNWIRDHAQ